MTLSLIVSWQRWPGPGPTRDCRAGAGTRSQLSRTSDTTSTDNMGIIEPYKKIDCIDINELGMQQRILELQLQMLHNEMKQVELIKSLQTSRETIISCEKEAEEARSKEALQEALESLPGQEFYHGSLSWQQSWTLLDPQEPGTFLVRRSQSGDARSPLAISFQRGDKAGGPTSIRVCLASGRWSLDSEAGLPSSLLPSFSSMPELIKYYSNPLTTSNCLVKLTRGLKRKSLSREWSVIMICITASWTDRIQTVPHLSTCHYLSHCVLHSEMFITVLEDI